MKNRKNIEKIGVAVLALLCVFLVFKLISELMGNPAEGVQPVAASSAQIARPAPQTDTARKSSASPKSASPMQVRPLDQYRPKPLPDLSRNPFNFGQPPLTPAQKAMQAARAGGAMTASITAGPPPIPLRAIGYSERGGAGPEAYLMDNDEIYVVHDGDLLSNRFRILKITSTNVEVQDGASGEKAQLPIPVVQ